VDGRICRLQLYLQCRCLVLLPTERRDKALSTDRELNGRSQCPSECEHLRKHQRAHLAARMYIRCALLADIRARLLYTCALAYLKQLGVVDQVGAVRLRQRLDCMGYTEAPLPVKSTDLQATSAGHTERGTWIGLPTILNASLSQTASRMLGARLTTKGIGAPPPDGG
jgi:hypothetical protein